MEIISNGSRALRLPQLTSEQRDALADSIAAKTPDKQALAKGLIIFNIDTECIEYWSGSAWIPQCAPVALPLTGGVILAHGGTIAPDETPSEFTSVVLPSGGVPPYTVECEFCRSDCDNETSWQSALILCPYSTPDLVGNYQSCAIDHTTEFRRKVTDAAGTTIVSNTITARVDLIAGTISQPGLLLMNGDSTTTITGTASSGGRILPPHSHQWQYCMAGCEYNANWYEVTSNLGGYTCFNPGNGLDYTTCKIE